MIQRFRIELEVTVDTEKAVSQQKVADAVVGLIEGQDIGARLSGSIFDEVTIDRVVAR
jgi:hypothetical protein